MSSTARTSWSPSAASASAPTRSTSTPPASAVSRCSTRLTRTPARWPNWCWPRPSCYRGGWIKSAANSFEIRGKKLGIVGYGSIGTQLSVLAEALGMQVFFYDPLTKLPLGNATQVASLIELLGMADIVSLHVPELDSTKWMIDEKEIRAMKKGSILINAARGSVGVIDALAAALKRSEE